MSGGFFCCRLRKVAVPRFARRGSSACGSSTVEWEQLFPHLAGWHHLRLTVSLPQRRSGLVCGGPGGPGGSRRTWTPGRRVPAGGWPCPSCSLTSAGPRPDRRPPFNKASAIQQGPARILEFPPRFQKVASEASSVSVIPSLSGSTAPRRNVYLSKLSLIQLKLNSKFSSVKLRLL